MHFELDESRRLALMAGVSPPPWEHYIPIPLIALRADLLIFELLSSLCYQACGKLLTSMLAATEAKRSSICVTSAASAWRVLFDSEW